MFSKIPDVSGIYKITCISTGKIYIGSALNLRNRWNDHLKGLRHNTHKNQKMQNAWNKHTESNFTFEVLELILIPEMLIPREQHWFDILKPFDNNGFNIARIAGSSLGQKRSPEACKNIADSLRGKPSIHKGKKYPLEHIEKLRASHLGQVAWNRGKEFSPESREKMRMGATSRMKTLIVTSPDGIEYVAHGLKQFCKEHNLLRHHLIEVADGKCKQHRGWTARYPENNEE